MSIALVLPVILSSDTLFSFCPQSFPASGTFPTSQLFTSMTKILEFHIQHQSFQVFRVDFPKIDCFYLLVVQGILRRFLQHHSSKASILQCPAFFTVQVSQLSMTPGKTIALTLWTFVGKEMSLLFNALSRFVI